MEFAAVSAISVNPVLAAKDLSRIKPVSLFELSTQLKRIVVAVLLVICKPVGARGATLFVVPLVVLNSDSPIALTACTL